MRGVIFSKAGAEAEISDSLEKPSPSEDQILVKSLYTAINPVDSYMSSSGLLVQDWPLVLGVDAGGVVVEVGEKAKAKFKVGDEVCGCTRLGTKGHSTCQEYFLMDAPLTLLKPANISIQQAATLGVGLYTASLGIYHGLQIPLPDPSTIKSDDDSNPSSPAPKSSDPEPPTELPAELPTELPTSADPPTEPASEPTDPPPPAAASSSSPPSPKPWIIVLGGSSSVGKYAIQLSLLSSYSVAASCSASSAELVRDLGAVPFDYKAALPAQAKEVLSITGGRVERIFDAAATGDALAKELWKLVDDKKETTTTTAKNDDNKETEPEAGATAKRWFTTTNDWSGISSASLPSATVDVIMLGPIGRGAAGGAEKLDAMLASYIPVLEKMVGAGKVVPNGLDVVEKQAGWEGVLEGLRYQQRGAGGANKVVVKIGDKE